MLGEWLSAQEGHRLGMVNRVVARAELQSHALSMAQAIAKRPQFAVRAAKVTINHAQDQAGRSLSVRQSFAMHQLTHANNELVSGASVMAQGVVASVAAKMPGKGQGDG